MFPNPPGLLRPEPHSPGLRDRIWWGAGSRPTAEWAAKQGLNLMSSTLMTEDAGVPFHELQAEQIRLFREAWATAGHTREPRVSVSRSIFALVDDRDRAYFGRGGQDAGPGRLHRRPDEGDLRAVLCRGARRPRQGAGPGHGDPGGRHPAAYGPEPARRRVQRPRGREHPEVRRPGARLALARAGSTRTECWWRWGRVELPVQNPSPETTTSVSDGLSSTARTGIGTLPVGPVTCP